MSQRHHCAALHVIKQQLCVSTLHQNSAGVALSHFHALLHGTLALHRLLLSVILLYVGNILGF